MSERHFLVRVLPAPHVGGDVILRDTDYCRALILAAVGIDETTFTLTQRSTPP